MPYSSQHKAQTRAKITEAARVLFNQYGFAGVTIDQVMEAAGLTRGGFYNHFASKEVLYREAVIGFLGGRGEKWRTDAGVSNKNTAAQNTKRLIDGYLSVDHLADTAGQCPMIALPSDVARASPDVQAAYQQLLEAMVGLFETDLTNRREDARERALALAALCVGGMVLARTLPDSTLAEEVRVAAQTKALKIAGGS